MLGTENMFLLPSLTLQESNWVTDANLFLKAEERPALDEWELSRMRTCES
jgi:hypothetical protein